MYLGLNQNVELQTHNVEPRLYVVALLLDRGGKGRFRVYDALTCFFLHRCVSCRASWTENVLRQKGKRETSRKHSSKIIFSDFVNYGEYFSSQLCFKHSSLHFWLQMEHVQILRHLTSTVCGLSCSCTPTIVKIRSHYCLFIMIPM